MHEGRKGNATFVRSARRDVVLIHLEKQFRHTPQGRRPPRIYPGTKDCRPGEPDQVSVIRIVIRMLVGQKLCLTGTSAITSWRATPSLQSIK
ncbi:MAG: hypothetical protein JWN34_5983 [Bryobacterales bacterium]|nr:hypothetical protein [Bryobacterales bacterium]